MKNIIFLALFTILFSSCKFSEDSRINKTIVCGKVTGYKQTSEHNMVTLLVPNLFTEKQVLYDLIKDDGSFIFEFDLNHPIDIELEYFGRPRLYASPGDSLYITIDGNCWTNVINNNQELYDLYQVSGRGSLLAQEVKNYSVFFEDSINIDFHTSDSIVKTSSPLEYASYMDEKLNHDLKRLDSYLSAQQDGKLVQEWAQTDIEQNNWWYRMRYIWTHPMKTGENMKQFVASIPESYYNFLYDANLTVDDFKTSWFAAIMQELDVKTTISIPQEIEDSVFLAMYILVIKLDLRSKIIRVSTTVFLRIF
nr:hypothetical protein [uncultured Carboxylicivirga sp.]